MEPTAPITDFPKMKIALGIMVVDRFAPVMVDSALFAQAESDLNKSDYSEETLRTFRHILYCGFDPGQTIEDFMADREMTEQDVNMMLGNYGPNPPLPSEFPKSVTKALSSLY